MTINLTKEEAEEIFYTALCNAEGTDYMRGYGLELDFEKAKYSEAKEKLKNSNANACYEDILMEILRSGGKLTYIDVEGEGEYTATVGIEEVWERVAKTPLKHLTNMIEEEDDAVDDDVVLQTVFWQEVMYG